MKSGADHLWKNLRRWLPGVFISVVALIVVFVSVQMGIRTVMGLLDSSPDGVKDKIIDLVNAVPGVTNCHSVRVRESGPQLFVELHIEMPSRSTVKTAHDKINQVEQKVKEVYPDIDITVHVDPVMKKE